MKYFAFLCLSAFSFAQGFSIEEQKYTYDSKAPQGNFKQPFTGKINGSKVRLRLQPNLNSLIIRELSSLDFVQVVGEIEDFYAVLPESSDKGYIFRTYVLDDVVEGSNVNVRLKPDMTSPILLQLQQGDKVSGQVCTENPKWIEIPLPSSVHFYVAKEFVSREGPLSTFKERIRQRALFSEKISSIETELKNELKKNFSEINLSSLKKEMESLGEKTKDLFPDLSRKVGDLLKTMQEEYLQKSIQKQEVPIPELQAPIEQKIATPPQEIPAKEPTVSLFLKEQEKALIEKKMGSHECTSQEDLYTKEKKYATPMKGVLVSFDRPLKIKPGDFLLLHPVTKVPMAYLYSTTIDLASDTNMVVMVEVAERPNHNFALPAYFVHTIQVTNN